ncbi:M20/M25/M40 family metallo-hydrolase [Pediococcus siamensis]|uniref:M20/M25/M40 family metallo-hydrolase n=1 Tax=Pediococcus siamensis TaxID=381829 RepID=UPI0039A0DA4B
MEEIKNPTLLLKALIQLPSTSENAHGQEAAVANVTALLEKYCGAHVNLIETNGKPIITATIAGEKQAAYLFYGHYDVMTPGDLDAWHSDPFTLTERHNRFYGRGTGDNKGQLIAMITGINHYLISHPQPPFTIKFLIEGEEEQGSPNLAPTVSQLKTTFLKDVVRVFVTDGSMNASGAHVLRLGNRGLFGFRLTVTTADHANHSGNAGNVIENPYAVLHQILSQLYDFDRQKNLIPHFYDGVVSPTAQEQEWLAALPFDDTKISAVFGSQLTASSQRDYYQKLMFTPTFNISGIYGGHTGKDVKTIVPPRITVTIDMRLVGSQSVQEIETNLATVLKPYVTKGVLKYEITGRIPPSKTTPSPVDLEAFHLAAKKANVPLVIEPMMPGTDPNYVWTNILGVKVFTVPLANFDQNNHDVDENITKNAFQTSIQFITQLISEFEKEGSAYGLNAHN